MHGGSDLHRRGRDVDAGQLLELVVHRGELLLDVVRRTPGDAEEDATVWGAPACRDLGHDCTRNDVAGQEFRWAAGGLVAVEPALGPLLVVAKSFLNISG